jgi:hypothetical protein
MSNGIPETQSGFNFVAWAERMAFGHGYTGAGWTEALTTYLGYAPTPTDALVAQAWERCPEVTPKGGTDD